jgi:enamine deaminase RidA (YjgF/YER057c/UK114 family)
MPATRIDNNKRLSQGVAYSDLIFLAGQVADKPVPDAKAQTQDILKKIDSLLARLGSSKKNLLSTTVFLADIRHFEAMNAAWDAWVDKANCPARATVEAPLARPEYLVEIMVTAHKNEK